MSFPTATTTAPPIDSRLSLDDFIANMNIDKDEIGPPPGSENREPVPMPGREHILTPEEEAKLSIDTANAAGEQLAGLVDNGSRALCGVIGGGKDDKYRISASQRTDLKNSYSRVATHYGFSGANPLVEALLLTFIILTPKFREAFGDRKIMKLEDEQQRQADNQRQMQADIKALEARQKLNDIKEKSDATGKTESAN